MTKYKLASFSASTSTQLVLKINKFLEGARITSVHIDGYTRKSGRWHDDNCVCVLRYEEGEENPGNIVAIHVEDFSPHLATREAGKEISARGGEILEGRLIDTEVPTNHNSIDTKYSLLVLYTQKK